jgi:hypothetical protein
VCKSACDFPAKNTAKPIRTVDNPGERAFTMQSHHISDYQLCRGNKEHLEQAVRTALADGWQLLGSPVALDDVLVQAMIRCDEGNSAGIEMVPRKPGPAEENL